MTQQVQSQDQESGVTLPSPALVSNGSPRSSSFKQIENIAPYNNNQIHKIPSIISNNPSPMTPGKNSTNNINGSGCDVRRVSTRLAAQRYSRDSRGTLNNSLPDSASSVDNKFLTMREKERLQHQQLHQHQQHHQHQHHQHHQSHQHPQFQTRAMQPQKDSYRSSANFSSQDTGAKLSKSPASTKKTNALRNMPLPMGSIAAELDLAAKENPEDVEDCLGIEFDTSDKVVGRERDVHQENSMNDERQAPKELSELPESHPSQHQQHHPHMPQQHNKSKRTNPSFHSGNKPYATNSNVNYNNNTFMEGRSGNVPHHHHGPMPPHPNNPPNSHHSYPHHHSHQHPPPPHHHHPMQSPHTSVPHPFMSPPQHQQQQPPYYANSMNAPPGPSSNNHNHNSSYGSHSGYYNNAPRQQQSQQQQQQGSSNPYSNNAGSAYNHPHYHHPIRQQHEHHWNQPSNNSTNDYTMSPPKKKRIQMLGSWEENTNQGGNPMYQQHRSHAGGRNIMADEDMIGMVSPFRTEKKKQSIHTNYKRASIFKERGVDTPTRHNRSNIPHPFSTGSMDNSPDRDRRNQRASNFDDIFSKRTFEDEMEQQNSFDGHQALSQNFSFQSYHASPTRNFPKSNNPNVMNSNSYNNPSNNFHRQQNHYSSYSHLNRKNSSSFGAFELSPYPHGGQNSPLTYDSHHKPPPDHHSHAQNVNREWLLSPGSGNDIQQQQQQQQHRDRMSLPPLMNNSDNKDQHQQQQHVFRSPPSNKILSKHNSAPMRNNRDELQPLTNDGDALFHPSSSFRLELGNESGGRNGIGAMNSSSKGEHPSKHHHTDRSMMSPTGRHLPPPPALLDHSSNLNIQTPIKAMPNPSLMKRHGNNSNPISSIYPLSTPSSSSKPHPAGGPLIMENKPRDRFSSHDNNMTPRRSNPKSDDGKENRSPGQSAKKSGAKRNPCNCKKSKCLKLYCECFAANLYCDGCNCTDCSNTKECESQRQKAIKDTKAKNPNAFLPRFSTVNPAVLMEPTNSGNVINTSGNLALPVSKGGHNMGCRCKKSHCLKKYCECFEAGVMCSGKCKCLECQNFVGSQALIDRRRKIKDHRGADLAMRTADEFWKGGRQALDNETSMSMANNNEIKNGLMFTSPAQQKRIRHINESNTPIGLSTMISPTSTKDGPHSRFPSGTKGVHDVSMNAHTQTRHEEQTSSPLGYSPIGVTPSPYAPSSSQAKNGKRSRRTNRGVQQSHSPNAMSPAPTPAKRLGFDSHVVVRKKRNMNICKNSKGKSTYNQVVLQTPVDYFGPNLPQQTKSSALTIFSFLSNDDIYNASLVNRAWSKLSTDDELWQF